MPHFDDDGNDTVICQLCARIVPGGQVDWRPDMTRTKSAASVCKRCQRNFDMPHKHDDSPISLAEHAHRESGYPLGSVQLQAYINRYYGHG